MATCPCTRVSSRPWEWLSAHRSLDVWLGGRAVRIGGQVKVCEQVCGALECVFVCVCGGGLSAECIHFEGIGTVCVSV